MKPPLESGRFLTFGEVESTQGVAAEYIRGEREGERPSVILARHQTAGRGRFGREWHDRPSESMLMSWIAWDYAGHAKPWLIGMAAGCAMAATVKGQIRWPNDVMLGGKKVGGILIELIAGLDGLSIPVVGMGLNLNQTAMPEELATIATSVNLETGQRYDPQVVAKVVLNRLAALPEPDSWESIAPYWMALDDTPGKRFRLADGRESVAVGVGPDGELECEVDGKRERVMAAEAILG